MSIRSERVDADEDPGHDPEEEDPEPCTHEEQPVGAVDPVVALERVEGDESDHRVDDDRAERRAGRFSNSVARNSIVARMNTALMSEAISVFWPASSATEVFDRLPSTTNPPTSPAAPFAIPCAMSSWFVSIS